MSRISTEYTLADRADDEGDNIALQDRSQSYLDGQDNSVSIFVTPETSLGDATKTDSAADLHKSYSPNGTPTGKTLQIRHSDSFDGSSYAGSSEDSDTENHNPSQKKRHIKHASLSFRRPPLFTYDGPQDSQPGGPGGAELELAQEAEFLATGSTGGTTRTADQAGAILGIANM